jgi:hypothetical protein
MIGDGSNGQWQLDRVGIGDSRGWQFTTTADEHGHGDGAEGHDEYGKSTGMAHGIISWEVAHRNVLRG